jgi:nucleoid-associated protein YgaU
MVSPINYIREMDRQRFARDDRFYKKYLYFFELRIPPDEANGIGAFWFPLAIPPESYSMETPFSVDKTQTQGGGLYVEEDGIVQRTIRLSGTTGFYPRRLPDTTATPLTGRSPEKKSFSRQLQTNILHKISGQRHFHYLEDAVFNTYGDLKRDPATAEKTQLFFHNLKDEQSWVVVPEVFSLKREARVLYRYDIQLAVVGPATDVLVDFSEDKTLFDEINDAAATVQRGIDLAQGALTDATAIASEIEGSIKNVAGIIDNVGTILTAASDFVSGVSDIIQTPFAFVTATADLIDEAINVALTTIDAVEDAKALPDNAIQYFRRMTDGLDQIGMHPHLFTLRVNRLLEWLKQQSELALTVSAERLAEAEEGSSPTTLQETENLGTRLTPGDAQSAQATLRTGRAINEYTSTRDYALAEGDTLVSLAARFLGDARLWTHIASVNNLKPPYVTQQAGEDLTSERSPFSGALGVGNKILLPGYDKPPEALPLLPTLGVRSEESAENHLLGVDVALEVSGGRPGAPRYTIAVDTDKGSNGPKLVEGVENLSQGMLLRLSIEQGTDVLFKQVGLGRIVGTKFILTDQEAARSKMIESLTQDSRIASVRKIDFSDSANDALVADIEAEVRGYTTQADVKVTL